MIKSKEECTEKVEIEGSETVGIGYRDEKQKRNKRQKTREKGEVGGS